jgi:hypothetical protein
MPFDTSSDETDPVLGILLCARDYLTPERWIQEKLVRQTDDLNTPDVCALGALLWASGLHTAAEMISHDVYDSSHPAWLATIALSEGLCPPGGPDAVAWFNDERASHSDIVRLYDRAIAKRIKAMGAATVCAT